MTEKSILIIGAGVAGLSAGCYGQMNGFKTTIFELHTLPGGLCTSWKRKGYTFDGCIHWLVGSGETSAFHRIWDELGALQGTQIVNHTEFMRVVGGDGKTFIVYTDPDCLEKHMLELAPGDREVILEFTAALRQAARMEMLPPGTPGSLKELWQSLRLLPTMLPMMGLVSKYGKMNVKQFSSRIQDPFLRESFEAVFDLPDFPMLAVLMSLGFMAAQNAGYPIGGSLHFAQAIEKRYLALGGQIHYQSRVSKILVENGNAVGLRLADGSEVRADYVISAADGHATIFEMLEGKYIDEEIRSNYANLPIFDPLVQVSLGVALDLKDQPEMASYQLAEPLEIAGQARARLGIKHFCYDPTLAPQGKSVIEVMFNSNYSYWKTLAEDSERYESEKKEIAIKIINQIEQRIPGVKDRIEVVDVATPLTYERYTGNWQGSMEGWLVTTRGMENVLKGKSMRKTLPGLDHFYMVGQWVEPGGGLPPAATSARGVVQLICKREKQRFRVVTT